jgi:hypothetical protein
MAKNRTMAEKNRRVKIWGVRDNRDRQARDIISERFDPKFNFWDHKPYTTTGYRPRPIINSATAYSQGELQYV